MVKSASIPQPDFKDCPRRLPTSACPGNCGEGCRGGIVAVRLPKPLARCKGDAPSGQPSAGSPLPGGAGASSPHICRTGGPSPRVCTPQKKDDRRGKAAYIKDTGRRLPAESRKTGDLRQSMRRQSLEAMRRQGPKVLFVLALGAGFYPGPHLSRGRPGCCSSPLRPPRLIRRPSGAARGGA